MNQFERVAVFTLIENIEHQLRGLKTLLAAGNNAAQVQQKPTREPPPYDGAYATAKEEHDLELQIEKMREAQMLELQKQAESEFSKQWREAGSQEIDG